MATTTTIIRTSSATGGGGVRRRARLRPRPRPRPRSRSQTVRQRVLARRTSTSTSRTEIRDRAAGGGGALRYILPAALVAGLLIWLWPRGDAQAGQNGGGKNGGGKNGGNGGGGGNTHPPANTRAVVQAQGTNPATGKPYGGMNLRPSPIAPVGVAPITALNNGTTITVVRSNIPEQGAAANAPMRWWEVDTPAGRGYIRAVGTKGEWNVNWTPGQAFAFSPAPEAALDATYVGAYARAGYVHPSTGQVRRLGRTGTAPTVGTPSNMFAQIKDAVLNGRSPLIVNQLQQQFNALPVLFTARVNRDLGVSVDDTPTSTFVSCDAVATLNNGDAVYVLEAGIANVRGAADPNEGPREWWLVRHARGVGYVPAVNADGSSNFTTTSLGASGEVVMEPMQRSRGPRGAGSGEPTGTGVFGYARPAYADAWGYPSTGQISRLGRTRLPEGTVPTPLTPSGLLGQIRDAIGSGRSPIIVQQLQQQFYALPVLFTARASNKSFGGVSLEDVPSIPPPPAYGSDRRSLNNGDAVYVLEAGIGNVAGSLDPAPREWWLVRSARGVGYVPAVNGDGSSNFITTSLGASGEVEMASRGGVVSDVAVPTYPAGTTIYRMRAVSPGNIRGAPDVTSRIIRPYAVGDILESPNLNDLHNVDSNQAPQGWVPARFPGTNVQGWAALHKFADATVYPSTGLVGAYARPAYGGWGYPSTGQAENGSAGAPGAALPPAVQAAQKMFEDANAMGRSNKILIALWDAYNAARVAAGLEPHPTRPPFFEDAIKGISREPGPLPIGSVRRLGRARLGPPGFGSPMGSAIESTVSDDPNATSNFTCLAAEGCHVHDQAEGNWLNTFPAGALLLADQRTTDGRWVHVRWLNAAPNAQAIAGWVRSKQLQAAGGSLPGSRPPATSGWSAAWAPYGRG